MSFLPDDVIISQSSTCIYDSNIGYQSNFTLNGDVDGWDYIDGIYLYTAWVGMLFGHLYGDTGTIGRNTLLLPIDAGKYYLLRIGLKYTPVPREGNRVIPTMARVSWRTEAFPQWDSTKQKDFSITADGKWYYYTINLGEAQYWQGSVNDLRFNLPLSNGVDGDMFYIRNIEILSVDQFKCNQIACSYYSRYSHPCGGVGTRGYTQSKILDKDSLFSTADEEKLILNINGYGPEQIDLTERSNLNLNTMADKFSKAISKVNIGGYSNAQVITTDDNCLRIYSGSYSDTSTAHVLDNDVARRFGFFNDEGESLQTTVSGISPATKYSPVSTFKVKTFQLLSLFDDAEKTSIDFDLNVYSIEGGRKDWYEAGVGEAGSSEDYDVEDSEITIGGYKLIYNRQKTLIDFLHPFNASGRIKKIYISGTVDDPPERTDAIPTIGLDELNDEALRKQLELKGAHVYILRPRYGGLLEVIHDIEIPDRDRFANTLYSAIQEVLELDVDVFVDKGDLIGVYNVHMYTGRTFFLSAPDAVYYQIEGKPNTVFDPGVIIGGGGAGLLLYARSEELQKRLVVDIDLRKRYNIENLEIYGTSVNQSSEVNLTRCVDVNWRLDTFNLSHFTYYECVTPVVGAALIKRENKGYGFECLEDGITFVRDGLAGDDFYIDGADYIGPSSTNESTATVGGPGVVAVNPRYFYMSGDEEWIGVHIHADTNVMRNVRAYGFNEDPIALYLHFPYGKTKPIYRSKIYFKERNNFRSFALSTYTGDSYFLGNADLPQYDLINYKSVTLDVKEYVNDPTHPLYTRADKYLFANPSIGHPILQQTGTNSDGYPIGIVVNKEQYDQAVTFDWQTLTHVWEPTECRGFRIYCDRHNSTKICEIELFSTAEDFGSSFTGSARVLYSTNGNVWWPSSLYEMSAGANQFFIGDTPQYISIEISPITELEYSDIKLNLTLENVHVGKKGCEYTVNLLDSGLGKTNLPQRFDIKNVYGGSYDLYVDISRLTLVERGLSLYSQMSSTEAILSPAFGPSGFYKKESPYKLINYNSNCAINTEVFGLKNLVDNVKAYSSTNNGETWSYFGTLTHNQNINFTNSPSLTRTIVKIPVSRSSVYWKIWFRAPSMFMRLREVNIYRAGEQLHPEFYYDENSQYVQLNILSVRIFETYDNTFTSVPEGGIKIYFSNAEYYYPDAYGGAWPAAAIVDGKLRITYNSDQYIKMGVQAVYTKNDVTPSTQPLTHKAPHLDNGVFAGSFYDVTNKNGIGIKFDDYDYFDTLVFYHDSLSKYDYSNIDPGVWLYLTGDGAMNTTNILDWSYYENKITNYGGVFVDYSRQKISYASLRFPSLTSKLVVDHSYGFDISKNHFSIGVYVMFEEYPADGEKTIIVQKWTDGVRGSFRLYTRVAGGTKYLEFQYIKANGSTVLLTYSWAYNLNTWYFVSIQRGDKNLTPTADSTHVVRLSINGAVVYNWSESSYRNDFGQYVKDLEIGGNFKGWMSDLMLACDPSPAGTRYSNGFTPPTARQDKRFTIDIYSSADNKNFGLHTSVDLFKGHRSAEFVSGGVFNGAWYNFFAIDFGERHSLDIIRSYGSATALPFDEDSYIAFSNVDSDNIVDANFGIQSAVLEDKFFGDDGLSPNPEFWRPDDQGPKIYSNTLSINVGLSTPYKRLDSSYTLMGDFDLSIDYDLIFYENRRDWHIGLEIYESGGTKKIRLLRNYRQDVHYYEIQNESGTVYRNTITSDSRGKLRLSRDGLRITAQYWSGTVWKILEYVDNWSTQDIIVAVYVKSEILYPSVSVNFDNYSISYGAFSNLTHKEDVRWVRLNLLNGDGVTRTINKVGIYPDILNIAAPGGTSYNSTWDYLGPSISNYDEGKNVALGVSIQGSSLLDGSSFVNLVDGFVTDIIEEAWLSGSAPTQWLILDLDSIKQIYKVKIYHGYNSTNTSCMITNYSISTSEDGVTYTQRISVTNTAFERSHDFGGPVNARYVKININSYTVMEQIVAFGELPVNFKGACIREVEVYEYYGFTYVSSETYPIVAMNLKKPFHIASHEVIGLLEDDPTKNWDNTDAAFSFIYNTTPDPRKIKFKPFGTLPGYSDNWVLVKKNTATNYGSGPHYLKHIKVFAGDNLNPCDHYWWWASSISEITNGFGSNEYCSRPLEINYPASSSIDDIFFKGGDDFGIDTLSTWRDGLAFNIIVSDLNDIDLNESFFYLEGYVNNATPTYVTALGTTIPDTTARAEQSAIKYSWSMTVLSGTHNNVFLKFKKADDVVYMPPVSDTFSSPLAVDKMTITRVGMILRGKGNPINIIWDGFIIKRNHFEELCKNSTALYLNGFDYATFPMAEFDLSAGTVEFWIKPDYNGAGMDFLNRYSARNLFHIINTNNDVFGVSVGSYGFGFYFGQVSKLNLERINCNFFNIDEDQHIAVVFSNNGKYISTDNSTIRFYLNNRLLFKSTTPWDVSDSKMFRFMLGGRGCFDFKEFAGNPNASSFDGIITGLKVLNYCKTDFSGSLAGDVNELIVEKVSDASKYIEISPDNLTFYNIESGELPLKFEKVPSDTYVPIYVRSILPDNINKKDTRTGRIIVSWELGV